MSGGILDFILVIENQAYLNIPKTKIRYHGVIFTYMSNWLKSIIRKNSLDATDY